MKKTRLDEVVNEDGLEFESHFSHESIDEHPYDQVEWDTYDVHITDKKGKTLFQQNGVEFPSFWGKKPIDIVTSKYFYGDFQAGNGTPSIEVDYREYSLKQLIDRVIDTIANAGINYDLFYTRRDAVIWARELKWLCLHQYGAFNSPVWFNVGLKQKYGIHQTDKQNWQWGWNDEKKEVVCVDPYKRPQGSACFIVDVKDTIEDIFGSMTESARLFKYGSGVGADWSKLRSTQDTLNGGGQPSGPVAFMRVQDEAESTIRSSRKTRCSAIMQTLKSWHPDVREFVSVKMDEEKKAHALIEEGYGSSPNGEAYNTVAFQNVNQSLRADDEFLQKAAENRSAKEKSDDSTPIKNYDLRSPQNNEVLDQCDPDEIMKQVTEGAYICGDPGIQYESTIHGWHTVPNFAPIDSSNSCSEYLHPNNTACNLASLNTVKFREENEKGEVQINKKELEKAARIFITGQEILVDLAGYPSKEIAENSHKLRPLGLGFANIGALIMSLGYPYDSNEGRAVASSIMAIEHFAAYEQSAKMARAVGPFKEFEDNSDPMMEVMKMHNQAAEKIKGGQHEDISSGGKFDVISDLWEYANNLGDKMVASGKKYGYRNSQATAVASTDTIGFYMDCTTKGIEPDIALFKFKTLSDESDKIVNDTVLTALKSLGYANMPWPIDYRPKGVENPENKTARDAIVYYIDQNSTIEGAPSLKEKHLPIFHSTITSENKNRSTHYGHIDMMGAVQPFVSGAISQTVHFSKTATREDIYDAYMRSWRKGLKAIAIYRNDSKKSQPMNILEDSKEELFAFKSREKMVEALSESGFIKHKIEDQPVLVDKSINQQYKKGQALLGAVEKFESGKIRPGEFLHAMGFENDFDQYIDTVIQNAIAKEEGSNVSRETSAQTTSSRYRLPENRPSWTHKFKIGGHEGYLTVSMYPKGYGYNLDLQPGEVFIVFSKEGSTLRGLADQWAAALSIMLQYGVPLKDICSKFEHVKFEPSGFTDNEQIKSAKSVVDYVARLLKKTFVEGDGVSFYGENVASDEFSVSKRSFDVKGSSSNDAPKEIHPNTTPTCLPEEAQKELFEEDNSQENDDKKIDSVDPSPVSFPGDKLYASEPNSSNSEVNKDDDQDEKKTGEANDPSPDQ